MDSITSDEERRSEIEPVRSAYTPLVDKLVVVLGLSIVALLIGAAALFGARHELLIYTLSAAMGLCALGLVLTTQSRREDKFMLALAVAGWLWVWWHPPFIRADSLQAAAALTGAVSVWIAGARMASTNSRRKWIARALILLGGAFVTVVFGRFALENGGAEPADTARGFQDIDIVLALLVTFSASRVTHVIKSASGAQRSRLHRLVQTISDSLWSVLIMIMAMSYLWAKGPMAGFVLAVVGLVVFVALDIRHWPKRGGKRGSRIWLLLAGATASAAAALLVANAILGDLAITSSDDARVRVDQLRSMFELQVQIWQQSPFFGHGLGSYDSVQDLTAQARPDLGHQNTSHFQTFLLRGLIETGLVGVGLALATLLHILVALRQAMNTTAKAQTPMKLAIVAIAIFGLAALVTPVWTSPAAIWLTVFFVAHGYGVACVRVVQSRPVRTSPQKREPTFQQITSGAN